MPPPPPHRPFSYSENECGSNDISLQFVEFSNVDNCDEALTPLYRTWSIKLYKNIARSRLFCGIAKRSIAMLATERRHTCQLIYEIFISFQHCNGGWGGISTRNFLQNTKCIMSFVRDCNLCLMCIPHPGVGPLV